VVEKAVKTEKIVRSRKRNPPSSALKFGGALTTMALSSGISEDLKMKLGLAEGIFLMVPLGKTLAFQPELSYIHKGAGIDTGSSTGKAKFEADYVEIQPLLKILWDCRERRPARTSSFGPQVG